MAKKKHVLTVDIVLDFALIGISCHHKDYKLCWNLNKVLGWELKKEEDYPLIPKNSTKTHLFSLFSWESTETGCVYLILDNKSEGQNVLPEQKSADFFLIIRGPYSDAHLSEIVQKLKLVPVVLTAFEINAEALPNKQNLYNLI